MITDQTGNIFACSAVIKTANTVDVMGKGLAL